MSQELKSSPSAASLTVYARVWNSAGQNYNTSSTSFENLNWSNVTHYGISATEFPISSTQSVYMASFPTAIVTAGQFYFMFYQQAGGSQAESDAPISGMGNIDWSGTAEVVLSGDAYAAAVSAGSSASSAASSAASAASSAASAASSASTAASEATTAANAVTNGTYGTSAIANLIKAATVGTISGTVASAASTTVFTTTAALTVQVGQEVVFDSTSSIPGQVGRIVTVSGTTITVAGTTAFTAAPQAGDTFKVGGQTQ